MKRFFIILLSLATCTVGAMAQADKAESLFNDFINAPACRGCVRVHSKNQNIDDGVCTSIYNHHTFALPPTWSYKVERLAEELGKLQPTAYKFFLRNANSGEDTQLYISVDSGISVLLGSHPDRNYLAIFFRSSSDTLRRHAYALAWYDDPVDSCTKGSLYQVYGLDPAKSAPKTSRRIIVNGQEIDLSSHYDSHYNALKSMGIDVTTNEQAFSSGGSTTNSSTVTVVNNARAKSREAATQRDREAIMSSDSVKIQTSSDFIQEFKRLHDIFINVHGDYNITIQFQSNIIARMDNMARVHGKLLAMKEERDLCIKMLKNMKKNTMTKSPKVTANYIDLIIKRLKAK